MSRIRFIINPAGRGGAGFEAWERFKSAWVWDIDPDDVVITERTGHAREISSESAGYDIIAAVGGDGTVGEIISGIIDGDVRSRLAVIPAGTGNDMARNIGIVSLADAVRALREGTTRTVDLLRIDCQVDGSPAHRYAFLAMGAGFSPIPMVRPWMKRILGPTGAYYLGSLLQIVVYTAPRMVVRIDGKEYAGRQWMVIAANAEKVGGGSMCIAPDARIDDGEMNVTIVPALSKARIVGLLPRLATGSHVTEQRITYLPAQSVEIESDPPAILDIDGDLFGTTPASIALCPDALRVMTPSL